MIINKAQRHTLSIVSLDLCVAYFSHEHPYAARSPFSDASNNLFVHIPDNCTTKLSIDRLFISKTTYLDAALHNTFYITDRMVKHFDELICAEALTIVSGVETEALIAKCSRENMNANRFHLTFY